MIVHGVDKCVSIGVTQRIGFPADYGIGFFGYTRFGLVNRWQGIYQRKKTKKGKQTSRMIHYWPTNPQTVPQQNWRGVFAAGKAAWDDLTETQKKAYNDRAYAYKFSGYNLFQREWLATHRLH